jgi:hypothetical protein
VIVHRFSQVLAELQALNPWLESLGIAARTTRIHKALETVRAALEGLERTKRTGEPSKIGHGYDFYYVLVEALEFFDIYRAFKGAAPPLLSEKLKRALSGPDHPAGETIKNSDGRNTTFELALAADLLLHDATVELAEPDMKITLDGRAYLIACKRPFYEHSIRSNVRGAADQLERELNNQPDTHGIIAISVSKIFNPGDKIFQAQSEADRERLGDLVEGLMQEREKDWQTKDLHPRIAAVLFNVRTPGIVEDRITMMSYGCIMPAGRRTDSFERLAQILSSLISY